MERALFWRQMRKAALRLQPVKLSLFPEKAACVLFLKDRLRWKIRRWSLQLILVQNLILPNGANSFPSIPTWIWWKQLLFLQMINISSAAATTGQSGFGE